MIAVLSGPAFAVNGRIVFGELEGDTAAVMIVENGAPIALPVWVRTTPGINIIGIHWPLASKNSYVASRDGINYDFDPFVGQNPGDSSWQSIRVLPPNPMGEDFTNQGLLAIKDFPRVPYPGDGINTNGEWWQVAEYYVTTTATNPTDTLLCDAFQAGTQPDNGGFVWADYTIGELPVNSFEYYYSCLSFSSNVDPVWCPVEAEYCGDAGATLCINICGTDANVGNDLHIVQTGGEGEYTEDVGGPGGQTSGKWCGNLPEGPHVISFELNDNAGGVVPLDINVVVRPMTLDISCAQGIAGGMAFIPVTVQTCSFNLGGMNILAGWDLTDLSLIDVIPSVRIDDGNEYWNVNNEFPCEDCPNIIGVRINWISDIDNYIPHAPAYPGDDPVFFMSFRIASNLPVGSIIPVTFYSNDSTDNTLSDSTGLEWFRPSLSDGCVEIVDVESYKGDPNVNGIFYEIGDVHLIIRYFIDGEIVWTENGTWDDAIQESSADLNNNGVIDVADLVRFLLIINGIISPPKFDPALAVAEVSLSTAENVLEISIDAGTDVGGVLLSLDHPGMVLGTPDAGGMDVASSDANATLRAVIYSLESNPIPAGKSRLLSIPIISNSGGSVEITEISAADAYGRPIITTVSAVTPLPIEYALLANYPNPFNAKTNITFALPRDSRVTIEIFDLLGRSVDILLNREMPAGLHSVIWDSADQSSGMYFYKIQAGDFVDTKKMLLLK